MAFKSVEQFNDERYHNVFRLVDDKESADVIFLYRSKADMLHADVHYLKSTDYSGYVHCIGKGCPVCAKKRSDGSMLIRLQEKLFIPLYNITKGRIEFWDRNWNNGFIAQLDREVFNIYDNPSEYVFKITRNGEFNSKDTRYTFAVQGKNYVMSYEQILAKFNTKMPDCYEGIVRSCSFSELTDMLQSQQQASSFNTNDMPAYVPVPRSGYQSSIPDTFVNAADAVGSDNPSDDPILSQFDDTDDKNIEKSEPDDMVSDDSEEFGDEELPDSPF